MTNSTFWTQCRWIPWLVVASFGIVIAVNSALAYFAIHSDTGLVTKHPFELGNGYNRVLDEGAAQDRLGWRGAVSFVGRDLHGRVEVRMADAEDHELEGLTVTARIVRPVEPMPEQNIRLVPSDHGYGAEISLPRPGQWDVRVVASREGQNFQFSQRIVVQ